MRLSWVAAQVGHRVGALGLLAVCAGIGLMVAGKRPFVPLLACAFGASVVGVVAGWLSLRWGEKAVLGLIAFNASIMCIAAAAMIASRMGWWHVVGLLATRGA